MKSNTKEKHTSKTYLNLNAFSLNFVRAHKCACRLLQCTCHACEQYWVSSNFVIELKLKINANKI